MLRRFTDKYTAAIRRFTVVTDDVIGLLWSIAVEGSKMSSGTYDEIAFTPPNP